jgi:integrase
MVAIHTPSPLRRHTRTQSNFNGKITDPPNLFAACYIENYISVFSVVFRASENIARIQLDKRRDNLYVQHANPFADQGGAIIPQAALVRLEREYPGLPEGHLDTLPASDTRPRTRKRGKSMSRRSGQTGCEEKSGKWYIVRFWMDVEGQEERKLMREKICPISGLGKLSASERLRKRKEIIAASGADTVEHFEKVVRSNHGVTFREQAVVWLDRMKRRKRNPVAPSTVSNWESHLEKWINPNIGEIPLDTVNNLAMKQLVVTMVASGKLGPKSIGNYTQVVKMVVASAINEQGEEIHPRKWNHDFIDLPVVKKSEQRRPSFTGEQVTQLVARTRKPKYRILNVLCAASGLRLGEALGIDIKNISPDCATIKIHQKAWGSQTHDFLKTENGKREIDLHSSVAELLKAFIGDRKHGLLFCTRTGKPLHQSNIVRRVLHPILLGDEKAPGVTGTKAGAHAFRRFRLTWLRENVVPKDLEHFWMGHADEEIGDIYSQLESNVKFRKEVAERIGIGFELPAKKTVVISKKAANVPNVPKSSEMPDVQLAASA